MTATATPDLIARDSYGRPLIPPPPGGTGRPKPYTRVSTLAKTLDDTYNLQQWACRMTALGIATDPGMAMRVAAAADNKTELNAVVKDAQTLAGAGQAAQRGTDIHAWTEHVDAGKPLDGVPREYRDAVAAYQRLIRECGLTNVLAEQFVVNDAVQAAGTCDRIYQWGERLVVGDLKTGDSGPKWIGLATALQVATYARAAFLNLDTGERVPLPVDHAVGLLVHVPQSNPDKAAVYTLDLTVGWEAAQTAYGVRQLRRRTLHKVVSE